MSEPPVYDDVAVEPRVTSLVSMTMRELVSTIVVGMISGLTVIVTYALMNQFVFGAVLCRPQSPADCSQAPGYAMIVAMVVGAIVGIAALARIRIYRPLLIVLALAIALWGFDALITHMAWYWAGIVTMLIFGGSYGLFAWAARIRSFALAVIVSTVLIVILRFAMLA